MGQYLQYIILSSFLLQNITCRKLHTNIHGSLVYHQASIDMTSNLHAIGFILAPQAHLT